MANEATISQESFYKSLGVLEGLASAGNPASVEQSQAEVISEKLEKGITLTAEEQVLVKSQICTGPNSDQKTWAGSSWEKVPGNGPGADKIKPDGTDYNERGMRKSIQEKVEKGIPLSAGELALLKSDLDKGDQIGKGKDGDKDDDKENYGRDMGKSVDQAIQGNETLKKGIEVSQFLSEFAKAMGAGFAGIEERMSARIDNVGQQLFNTLNGFAAEQGEFNKGLAQGVVNIGHGVAGSIQQIQQVSEMPAGAPRSQGLQVIPGGQAPQGQPASGFINKSFEGPQGGQQLSKAMIGDALNDMIQKSEPGITPLDVIKFDTCGELRPDLQQRVSQRFQAGR